jgi:hypothetical protein
MDAKEDRVASTRKAAIAESVIFCKRIAADKPTADVAHPGTARFVKNRAKMTALAKQASRTDTKKESNSNRANSLSVNTEIALNPWTTSDSRFMEELPEYRVPRRVGTRRISSRDRIAAAAK